METKTTRTDDEGGWVLSPCLSDVTPSLPVTQSPSVQKFLHTLQSLVEPPSSKGPLECPE